ncbi:MULTISPECIES: ABC transporter substrate-binding protein [Microbacterium]|uniref:ABC transporter substrate-binding protein n=1 Tax=Microbacterium TaxID=33882 RepID=UPI0004680FE2|nr:MULTISPECIES: sugar ABC transporter substrate-binding protein [Microbacterium]AMG82838.1 hypothetical protein AXH82_05130 [Microbacterium sp. PAMC 28756]QXE29753.1 sugar ABC transporter substrate-binding protein [Microbacterium paraoxydans]
MRSTRILPALAALGVVALATGCASSAPSGEGDGPVEITYWLWQDDATDPTWTELADEFNGAQDDVKVVLETIPLDQYQNQLVSSAMNGTGPDAARSKDWWLGQFAPQGAIADLTSYVDGWDASDDVVDSLWATGQLPGEDAVYMLPHQYTTLYLYYRTDYFEELGLEAPRTQQDLLDAAAALTGDGRYGIDVRGGAGGQDQWLAWMYAGGASVVDDSGEVVLDDAKGVTVNEDYLRIVTDLQAAPPGSITAAFADVKTNFVEGLTGMMIHHPGSLKELQGVFGDKLGVVPIPTADGEPGATLGSMSGNVILEGSDKKDAAWEWISWLSEEAQMEKISASPQGQLPVLESVIDTEAYSSDPQLAVAVDAIPTAKTWPALEGVAELAAKEWNPLIQQAFQGEISSQDVLTKMSDVLR